MNSLWPRQSFTLWKKQALSAILPFLGHLLSTWSRQRREAGGLVVIIMGEILSPSLIDILFPTLPIFPPGYQVLQFSLSLISERVIIRFRWLQRMLRRQSSSLPSECLSFCACSLVFMQRRKYFSTSDVSSTGRSTFLYCYLDVILIFSKNLSSHIINLREVFLLCCQHGLRIGLPKCEFAVFQD